MGFCYDRGDITIPNASTPERIIEYLAHEIDISTEIERLQRFNMAIL